MSCHVDSLDGLGQFATGPNLLLLSVLSFQFLAILRHTVGAGISPPASGPPSLILVAVALATSPIAP